LEIAGSAAANPLKRLALCAGAALAIAAASMLVVAPLGYRAGWLSTGAALRTLPTWAIYFGVAGAAGNVLIAIAGFARAQRGRAAVALLCFAVSVLAAYVPWHYRMSTAGAPPINDITTDTDNPPPFLAILPVRAAAGAQSADYGGPATAALQNQAYPDIQPVRLNLSADKAFELALAAVRDMGWNLVAAEAAQGRIEASARTGWYGFTDDVVIRVAAEGTGARIDIRSKSRVGRSDLGVNAQRIREFTRRLKAN